eukprot:TRINITY_DN3181_c6_g1_i1.p1 TRINITY_DN3181_c6_g1~~TRINITY_DN3181_c6_g1_i1.p1  ORF type:complete len:105 (-),score=13.82 TRINITY_DN3181_c6_g1_i1:337-651(-)
MLSCRLTNRNSVFCLLKHLSVLFFKKKEGKEEEEEEEPPRHSLQVQGDKHSNNMNRNPVISESEENTHGRHRHLPDAANVNTMFSLSPLPRLRITTNKKEKATF